MTLRELSLFSGAGGGLLGTALMGWRLQACVEFNPYCQQVLRQRMADGVLEEAPVYGDVREFDGRVWRGRVDVITAGFPCQPFSAAGRQRGADDPKNQWPATSRIIREVQPKWVFLENVPRIVNAGRSITGRSYLERVLGDLAEAGFDAAWDCVSAAQLGAPHKRERWWLLGHNPSYPNSSKLREQQGWWSGACWASEALTGPNGQAQSVAYTKGQRLNKGRLPKRKAPAVAISPERGEHVAHTNGERKSQQEGCQQDLRRWAFNCCKEVANTSSQRREERQPASITSAPQVASPGDLRQQGWWEHDPAEGATQPSVGRVADGVANRTHRLAALGNGQVPAVVVAAFNHLHSILFA